MTLAIAAFANAASLGPTQHGVVRVPSMIPRRKRKGSVSMDQVSNRKT